MMMMIALFFSHFFNCH